MQLSPTPYISVQLKYGCGDPNCTNNHCRSSKSFSHMLPDDSGDSKWASQLAKQITAQHGDAAVCPLTISRILSLWLKGVDLLPNATRLPLGHFLWKYGNPSQFSPDQGLQDFINKLDRLKLVQLESCIPFEFLTIMLRNQLVSFDGLSSFLFHNFTLPQAILAIHAFFETIFSVEEQRALAAGGQSKFQDSSITGTAVMEVCGPGMDLIQTFCECVESFTSILEASPDCIASNDKAIDAIILLMTLPEKLLCGRQHLFLSLCDLVVHLPPDTLQVLRLGLESFCTVFQAELSHYVSTAEQLAVLQNSSIFSPKLLLERLVKISKNYLSRLLLVKEVPNKRVTILDLKDNGDSIYQVLHMISILHALNLPFSYDTTVLSADTVKSEEQLNLLAETAGDRVDDRPEVKTRFIPESLFMLEYINSRSYLFAMDAKYWLMHYKEINNLDNASTTFLYSREQVQHLSSLAFLIYDDELSRTKVSSLLALDNSLCKLSLTPDDLSTEEIKYQGPITQLNFMELAANMPPSFRTQMSTIKDIPFSAVNFTFLSYPFLLDPMIKVQILCAECCYENLFNMGTVIYPNRFNIFYDTLDHIIGHSPEDEHGWRSISNRSFLRKPLRITFDWEDGIDQGGPRTEFFNLICDEMFSKALDLFEENQETHSFYFNRKNGTVAEGSEQWIKLSKNYCFAGMILGMCLLNRVNITNHFPRVLYRKLLGYKGVFEDLENYDLTIYKGLCNLYNYAAQLREGSNLPSIKDTFCLTFTALGPNGEDVPLIEGGQEIYVDEHNVEGYIKAYANYILNDSVSRQFEDFADGFHLLVRSRSLTLFTPADLEIALCGEPNLDFIALKNNTKYDEPLSPTHPLIVWFWDIVLNVMTQDQRKALLKFVCGSARAPVGGLSRLRFKITLNGDNDQFLPTSHTCFGILMLPNYSLKEILQERLFKAIQYDEGFGLK